MEAGAIASVVTNERTHPLPTKSVIR